MLEGLFAPRVGDGERSRDLPYWPWLSAVPFGGLSLSFAKQTMAYWVEILASRIRWTEPGWVLGRSGRCVYGGGQRIA